MQDREKPVINRSQKVLNIEYLTIKTLIATFGSKLEKLADIFEQLSPQQKSDLLRDLENTQQNISAFNGYLNYLNKKPSNQDNN